ncbi:MAG: hypothetical protein JNL80_06485 [Phycisphaerae bacterium]|jgi:hypothetical protein|nr:hypothetical protein [Phycisphaerae bacterium]
MTRGNDRPIKRFSLQATSLLFIAASAVISGAAHAGATFYSSFSEWSTATSGAFDTLDFNLGSLQFLGEQYSQYGVHFNGTSALAGAAPDFFPLDGWGIASASDPNPIIPVALDGGRFAFGVEYVGDVRFQIFSGSTMMYDSGNHYDGIQASGFAGVVMNQPFDSIKISGALFTTLAADNFYVGHAVPAPGALAALALLGKGRRRRR